MSLCINCIPTKARQICIQTLFLLLAVHFETSFGFLSFSHAFTISLQYLCWQCSADFCVLFIITVLKWRRDAERCELFIKKKKNLYEHCKEGFFSRNLFRFNRIHIYFLSPEDFWCAAKSGMAFIENCYFKFVCVEESVSWKDIFIAAIN